MGDEDEGGLLFEVQAEDEVDHGLCGGAIEVAGRFVAEEDLGAIDEGAGEGHALLFAAGKLDRIMVAPLPQPDPLQERAGFTFAAAIAAQLERHEHVLERGERGDELEILENETDVLIAHAGTAVLVHRLDRLAGQNHLSRSRAVEPGAETEKGGLAAARGPDDRERVAGGEGEIDLVEDGEIAMDGRVSFGEPLDFKHGLHTRAEGREQSATVPIYQTMRLLRLALVLMVTTLVVRGAAEREKTILFFGDSLTAGHGLEDPALAFPGLIQKRIEAEKLPYRVVNAGLSGETTAGGARRIDWVLRQPIDIFVLELGGNDGLRGLTPEQARGNLQTILDRVRAKNPEVKIVLAGMMMPPSMGQDYARRFAAIYPELAEKNGLIFVPFILEGVGGVPALNQADQIHPNARGHAVIAENLWKTLRPLLKEGAQAE